MLPVADDSKNETVLVQTPFVLGVALHLPLSLVLPTIIGIFYFSPFFWAERPQGLCSDTSSKWAVCLASCINVPINISHHGRLIDFSID